MTIAYIGIGANLGDRHTQIDQALGNFAQHKYISLIETSNRFSTSPVGVLNQPNFINLVCSIKTSLSALQLLDVLMEIEQKLGRVREGKWGPRTIDLDLLSFGREVINGEKLTIPHPRLHERLFVLIPLLELNLDSFFPYTIKELNNFVNVITNQNISLIE
ncbi:2-amino-4-hydroxy-6-hydroxymethyldihydropteridine diphosphokinase [Paenibacillus polymyxa]|uniref:2-amino-4-hydroxy-6- hydroxymethyldihydropteridine diphosphokinase n=1 Tax=Paenibacillus polymyxa TaxID=1406 RepID=UPI0005CE95C2|nr:2-amino-4-hydroxy-6-hydroxymethyldihydropteridine diphosphokinase [Paenibacillus polymyxa]MBY7740348.1 2-amino-4-hydroxy-6-hydroxymethyldihydropteridine diphosphokinase [Paenibacillus polymyxa]MEE4580499.1 2-amino-4-hydroxy-6-hydroxymethyldihydropteridine diphosphokinase [Paenibacillus polymyxa]